MIGIEEKMSKNVVKLGLIDKFSFETCPIKKLDEIGTGV